MAFVYQALIFIGVLAALSAVIWTGIDFNVTENLCSFCGEINTTDHYCEQKLRIIRNAQRRGVYEYGAPIIRVMVHCKCGRTHEGVPIVPRSKTAHDKTVHIGVNKCRSCFHEYGTIYTYQKNFKGVVLV